MSWSIQHIFDELVQLGESPRIEAKQANEIGPSVMQTICAFANEPGLGGGWLLLGIAEPDHEHDNFWMNGVQDIDNLLGALQNNCRNQFEHPVSIECKHAKIDGKSVIGVFVHELEPSAKPCRFIGKPDKHNKRKTGVWRRGANGDYECTEKELEPILLAKTGTRYEQIILPDVSLDDLDENAIELYRRRRAKVRPEAPELQADNLNLLRALRVVNKQGNDYVPNIAGLLLFGKPLSLRGFLPAARVDYIRMSGTEWVEDPEKRFQYSLDFREPLISLIPKLENTILDEMPYHFRLEVGQIQRSDTPLLPEKVIREAIVNAVMHRDYSVQQPSIIARYRNRIEMRNAGYSLKPLDEFDHMTSVLRNPILAHVLYDLDFAETKGTGISTMQRLLHQAGLTKPIFISKRESNHFTATFLLHQLMNEEQLQWLQQFKHLKLSNDEAKALVLVKEIGAIDNGALRAITDLDTLQASQLLRKLWQQRGLIEKGGRGSASYYKPSAHLHLMISTLNASDLIPNTQELGVNTQELRTNTQELSPNTQEFPEFLRTLLSSLTPKTRKSQLQQILLHLCCLRAYSAEDLARILSRKLEALRVNHLTPMRKDGLINYLYPQVTNHPEQAYITTIKGKQWLDKHSHQ